MIACIDSIHGDASIPKADSVYCCFPRFRLPPEHISCLPISGWVQLISFCQGTNQMWAIISSSLLIWGAHLGNYFRAGGQMTFFHQLVGAQNKMLHLDCSRANKLLYSGRQLGLKPWQKSPNNSCRIHKGIHKYHSQLVNQHNLFWGQWKLYPDVFLQIAEKWRTPVINLFVDTQHRQMHFLQYWHQSKWHARISRWRINSSLSS